MGTESIAVQMKNILNEYSEEVQQVTEREIEKTSREAVLKLRDSSPRNPRGKNPGRYARGWAVKKEGRLTSVVYNRTDYQLTHLLENGHAVKPDPKHPGKKSRVEGIKHIKPVEEWVQNIFTIRISQGLK